MLLLPPLNFSIRKNFSPITLIIKYFEMLIIQHFSVPFFRRLTCIK